MAWTIEYTKTARGQLLKMDRQSARRIADFLDGRVAILDDPRSIGEALKGSKLGSFWKYRVGDYRVIADIHDEQIQILVVQIGNRKERRWCTEKL